MTCSLCDKQMYKIIDEIFGQIWECECGNTTNLNFKHSV